MFKKNVPVVYLISDGQKHVKIGVASDIQSRLNTLQVGSAYELNVLHLIYTDTIDEAYEIEAEYHAALSEHNIRGEWYDEDAVEKYYKYGTVDDDRTYLCDIDPNFNLLDVLKAVCGVTDEDIKKYKQKRGAKR